MTVYCIRSECGAVKIGVAANVQRRLDMLQTGSATKLEIVGVLPGGKDREGELHKQFREQRKRGEWFEDADGRIVAQFAPYLRKKRKPVALHDHPLSRWLAAHRVTQAALARYAGVSKGYVTELLNGTKTPSLVVAVKIADATGGAIPIRSWVNPQDYKTQ